ARVFTFGARTPVRTGCGSLQSAALPLERAMQKWCGVPERLWAFAPSVAASGDTLPLSAMTAKAENNRKAPARTAAGAGPGGPVAQALSDRPQATAEAQAHWKL